MLMKKITFSYVHILLITVSFVLLTGCGAEEPTPEDTPELITEVTLKFSPTDGSEPVIVTAVDPDGEGVKDIQVNGTITLFHNKTYVLTIGLINGLALPDSEAYQIDTEVEEEGDEHIFFFGWTNNVFADPSGNGNIDNRNDPVNYTGGENSKDENGLPLGLTTTWTASKNTAEGSFRILLKHQPGLKSETSGATDGETDLDLTFGINVQ